MREWSLEQLGEDGLRLLGTFGRRSRRSSATTYAGFSYDHEQPEEGFRLDPWAAYAVVESDGASLEVAFRRVPFDVGAVLEAIRSSGVPRTARVTALWTGG